jgi:hypothetical protein
VNIRHIIAVGVAALALAILTSPLTPARAQDLDKVHKSMDLLKAEAAKLGAPKIDGSDTVAGKTVPAIYFGSTKMNNNFDLVDDVVKQMAGTATIFVKSGDDYVRVATNVKKPDGSRAIGTVLDPNGKAIVSINKNEAFYGDVDILGNLFTTGYEPIHDASGAVIGISYVGYKKQ